MKTCASPTAFTAGRTDPEATASSVAPNVTADMVADTLRAMADQGVLFASDTQISRALGCPPGVTAAVTAAKRARLVRTRRVRVGDRARTRYVALPGNARHLPRATPAARADTAAGHPALFILS